MKKSTNQKRKEAVARMKAANWEDSKAFRTGSKSQDDWEKWRTSEIERLSN